VAGSGEHGIEPSRFRKGGKFFFAERLLASENWLCSMKLALLITFMQKSIK
jgi:hypothetical protein